MRRAQGKNREAVEALRKLGIKTVELDVGDDAQNNNMQSKSRKAAWRMTLPARWTGPEGRRPDKWEAGHRHARYPREVVYGQFVELKDSEKVSIEALFCGAVMEFPEGRCATAVDDSRHR